MKENKYNLQRTLQNITADKSYNHLKQTVKLSNITLVFSSAKINLLPPSPPPVKKKDFSAIITTTIFQF